ncbi:MAG: heavy metal-associated domain-containing protein [Gemmatimonadaceae bacterium]
MSRLSCSAGSGLKLRLGLSLIFAVIVPFAALAAPLNAESQASAGRAATVVVQVKDMSCESCEKTIRAMLMRTAGVKSAVVSARRSSAIVEYDPSRTTPAAIVATINRLGYPARIAPATRRTT